MSCDSNIVGDIEDLLDSENFLDRNFNSPKTDGVAVEPTSKPSKRKPSDISKLYGKQIVQENGNARLLSNSNSPKHCSVLTTENITASTRQLKCDGINSDDEANCFLPGTQRIYLKTWGCSHNTSDSEYMAGILAASGYTLSFDDNSKFSADLWVLNSCTVKTPSEVHLMNLVQGAMKENIPVVVAGCVPQAAPKTTWLKGLSVVGVQQIDRIVEVVEETLKGNCLRLFSTKKAGRRRLGGASLALPKIRKNPLIEILAINTGCLNHCTYCKTKQARGDLASYPIEELVERAKQAFGEGVKEIWLTSEDLGAYGRDIGVRLPDLLYALVGVIPNDCMMRLGMTNPPYILDHLEEISEILNHPRVYAFLHIPIQSGSDAVLTDMRREYTSKDFCTIVDHMIKTVPDISVATDVICGFPTETYEDFVETMEIVRKYKFPSLFINQYYPRPNTPAARMRRIDTVEVKRRTKQLSELFRSYKPYNHLINSVHKVLVTEEAFDGIHLVGHTKAYQQVLVPNLKEYMGRVITVKIVEAGKHHLLGQVVSATWKDSMNSWKSSLGNWATKTDLGFFLLLGSGVVSILTIRAVLKKI